MHDDTMSGPGPDTSIHLYTARAAELDRLIAPVRERIKRPAAGALRYDYLCPAGPYDEQWDWDGFFMGVALAASSPDEAIWLKHWCLNFILNSAEDGFTPGCLTPQGRDPRLHHMKPFLAQGAYLAGKYLGDFTWLRPHYARLRRIVDYRETGTPGGRMWNADLGLGLWHDAMESGADNNVAFPPDVDEASGQNRVAGADLNTFLYREYRAMARLAGGLGHTAGERHYARRAAALRDAIEAHLWSEADGTYYNLDATTGQHFRRITYSNFVPLWGGLAATERASRQIRTYLLDAGCMWGDHGLRTLAADDRQYNNANIIKPCSNWQGPVWPITNFLYMHGLLSYGFRAEAIAVAARMVDLCLDDIRTSGGMHENYHAETGKPLAAPGFISWNILVPLMPEQALSGTDPFSLA